MGPARAISRREHLGNARSSGAGLGLALPLPNDIGGAVEVIWWREALGNDDKDSRIKAIILDNAELSFQLPFTFKINCKQSDSMEAKGILIAEHQRRPSSRAWASSKRGEEAPHFKIENPTVCWFWLLRIVAPKPVLSYLRSRAASIERAKWHCGGE
uniref:Uncharacterized protein n=1 Tax=Cannabis sativa TaxID=3483 RepID=A0A803PVQ9_CANSA